MEFFKRLVSIFSFMLINSIIMSNEAEEAEPNTILQRSDNIRVPQVYLPQTYTESANTSKDHLKIKRPNSNTEQIDSIRRRRGAQKPDQKITAIRKRLEAEKRKEQMMNDPRLDPNQTVIPTVNNSVDPRYGGINTEQTNNNNVHDKLHQLLSTHKKETSNYVAPKIECDFESPCTWKWKADSDSGFRISAGNKMDNETGPPSDADSEYMGKFYTCFTHIFVSVIDIVHSIHPLRKS